MESKILNALGIDPAFIFLFMLILFVVLFILYVNVTMKYNRLKNSYATFMKGKDGKSLEQSLKDKFEEAEAVLKFTKQNRTEIRELNRKLETNYQKVPNTPEPQSGGRFQVLWINICFHNAPPMPIFLPQIFLHESQNLPYGLRSSC